MPAVRPGDLGPSRRLALATVALAVAVILHGSLWPYEFRVPADARGPIEALLQSWTERPSGLGDILGNILFYMPFGLGMALALRGPAPIRLCLAVVCGAALSLAMEVLQFYDPGRVSSLWDVASNSAGTAVGAGAGLLVGARLRVPVLRELGAHPAAAFLLLAMLAYRLVPFVPVIDLHKYWAALKPLVFGPGLSPWDTFGYFAVWLTAGALLGEVFGARASMFLAPLAVGAVLGAKVVIHASVVTRSEVVGAALAVLLAWPLLRRSPARAAVVGAVLFADVLGARLQPFTFVTELRPFGWVPFRSFLHGSLLVNVASLAEKLFLYGSLVWLWARAGLRLGGATALVGVAVLATSVAQAALPDRSAEITDALLVLLVAGLLAMLEPAALRSPAGATYGPVARPSARR